MVTVGMVTCTRLIVGFVLVNYVIMVNSVLTGVNDGRYTDRSSLVYHRSGLFLSQHQGLVSQEQPTPLGKDIGL